MTIPDIVVLTTSPYAKLTQQDTLDVYHRNILEEDTIVVEAFEKRGLSAERVGWDTPGFDWRAPKAIIIRTIWDYFNRYGEFAAWLEEVTSNGVFILNPGELLAWNIDKHYLGELQEKRIRVCKTTFVEIGVLESKSTKLSTLIEENLPWDEFVVKPCISGAARETYRLKRGEIPDEVNQKYAEMNKDEAFIVQPFQHNVPKFGEVSVMVFNNAVTHAVLKKAKEGDFRVQDDHGGTVHSYEVGDEERKFALQCVAACPQEPLYARVDIFKDNDGHWALAELELIEPELWFRKYPAAADILVDGVISRLKVNDKAVGCSESES